MLKILIIFVLIISGCVSNPKYSDPKSTFEEQAQKYPENADEIRQQYQDYVRQQNIQKSQPGPQNSYSVTDEKTSGWSIGNSDALVHLGSNKYKYHHKINITLICDKNSFAPKPYGHKTIRWKVSKNLYGEIQTSLNGEAKIYFNTEASDPFHKVVINTDQNEYEIGLSGYLLLELKKSDCEN